MRHRLEIQHTSIAKQTEALPNNVANPRLRQRTRWKTTCAQKKQKIRRHATVCQENMQCTCNVWPADPPKQHANKTTHLMCGAKRMSPDSTHTRANNHRAHVSPYMQQATQEDGCNLVNGTWAGPHAPNLSISKIATPTRRGSQPVQKIYMQPVESQPNLPRRVPKITRVSIS